MSELSARRTATRERLMDAAVGVFAAKGVLGASVEEICEAAGFTRGAFYSNFDSKDELCLAMMEYLGAKHLEALEATVSHIDLYDADLTIEEAVDHAYEVFLSTQSDDRDSILATIEMRLFAIRSESLREPYLAFVDQLSTQFISLIEAGAARFGHRLAVSGVHLVSVLQGVYEQGAVATMLGDRPLDSPERSSILVAVLRSMLIPINA